MITQGHLLSSTTPDEEFIAIATKELAARAHTTPTPPTPMPEDPCDYINELIMALHDTAAPYQYFGVHPNDPNNFGFWPDWLTINEDVDNGKLLLVQTLDQIPHDHSGPVIIDNPADSAPVRIIAWSATP
jgi:hypothetical protein|tara:strand:+ start:1085 stop:1474 length:390 start_codon:yes stop_codon:yes gene_type:complete